MNFLLGRNPHLLHYATRQGKKHEKHLLHRRESNPTKTIMENQCYSREPHWKLSKKEVKNVFHYEESNLEKTIMEKSTLSSQTALNNTFTIMNQQEQNLVLA